MSVCRLHWPTKRCREGTGAAAGVCRLGALPRDGAQPTAALIFLRGGLVAKQASKEGAHRSAEKSRQLGTYLQQAPPALK